MATIPAAVAALMLATSPPQHTPAHDAALLPAGSSIQGTDIHLTSGKLKKWDWTGYSVWIDGGQDVTFDGAKFSHPGANGPILAIGTSQGVASADRVTCNDCEVDETGIGTNFESGVKNYGTLTFNRSWLHGAPRDFISQVGVSLTLTDVLIQSPGLAAPAAAHVEAIHFFGGVGELTRVTFDVTDGVGKQTGACTAPLFVQAYLAPVSVHLDQSSITGAAGMGCYYAIQEAQGGPLLPATLAVSNTVLEKARSGYVAPNGATIIDGGGNTDRATGAAIKLP